MQYVTTTTTGAPMQTETTAATTARAPVSIATTAAYEARIRDLERELAEERSGSVRGYLRGIAQVLGCVDDEVAAAVSRLQREAQVLRRDNREMAILLARDSAAMSARVVAGLRLRA